MFGSFAWRAGGLRAFRVDDSGSASTEWAVAVAIVVMMAVPVMAVISDGSELSSNDMVISIQETDSFGGRGLHPGEGQDAATREEDELYVPGADLGIGPDPEGEEDTNVASANDAERPRYFDFTARLARSGGGGSRLALYSGGGRGGRSGGDAVRAASPGSSGGSHNNPGPSSSKGTGDLPLRADNCYDVRAEDGEPRHANYVVASGR